MFLPGEIEIEIKKVQVIESQRKREKERLREHKGVGQADESGGTPVSHGAHVLLISWLRPVPESLTAGP